MKVDATLLGASATGIAAIQQKRIRPRTATVLVALTRCRRFNVTNPYNFKESIKQPEHGSRFESPQAVPIVVANLQHTEANQLTILPKLLHSILLHVAMHCISPCIVLGGGLRLKKLETRDPEAPAPGQESSRSCADSSALRNPIA